MKENVCFFLSCGFFFLKSTFHTVSFWIFPTFNFRANDSLLLALYEAVHSSRNFVTVFAYIQPHERPPQPPSDEEIEADHQDDSIGIVHISFSVSFVTDCQLTNISNLLNQSAFLIIIKIK